MVIHVAYQEERYPTAERCVAGIRGYVDRGWDVSQLQGPARGPFVVVFRIEDESPEAPETVPAGNTRSTRD